MVIYGLVCRKKNLPRQNFFLTIHVTLLTYFVCVTAPVVCHNSWFVRKEEVHHSAVDALRVRLLAFRVARNVSFSYTITRLLTKLMFSSYLVPCNYIINYCYRSSCYQSVYHVIIAYRVIWNGHAIWIKILPDILLGDLGSDLGSVLFGGARLRRGEQGISLIKFIKR